MRRGGPQALVQGIENAAALLLAVLWLSPLLYALWAAFHPPEYAIRFDLTAPLTLENFREAWEQAPFARYFLNTVMLVTSIPAARFVLLHARRLCLRPVRVSGPTVRVYPFVSLSDILMLLKGGAEAPPFPVTGRTMHQPTMPPSSREMATIAERGAVSPPSGKWLSPRSPGC